MLNMDKNLENILASIKLNEETFEISAEHVDCVKEIIDNINSSDLIELQIAGLLKKLPYNYGLYIVENLNSNLREHVREYFESIIYGEFLKETKLINKNGKTKFEKKVINQEKEDEKYFILNRQITRLEIESLFIIACDEEKINYVPSIYRTYNGKNIKIKALCDAKKQILKEKLNKKLVDKVTHKKLNVILTYLKEKNVKKEL